MIAAPLQMPRKTGFSCTPRLRILGDIFLSFLRTCSNILACRHQSLGSAGEEEAGGATEGGKGAESRGDRQGAEAQEGAEEEGARQGAEAREGSRRQGAEAREGARRQGAEAREGARGARQGLQELRWPITAAYCSEELAVPGHEGLLDSVPLLISVLVLRWRFFCCTQFVRCTFPGTFAQ